MHSSGLLGASPDGIDVLGVYALEIKCPWKHRKSDNLKKSFTAKEKYLVSYDEDGQCTVNRTHEYYHQIQGQLYFADRAIGLFFIWTPHTHELIEIPKDPDWVNNISLLVDFYFDKFVPNCLQNTVADIVENHEDGDASND